MLLVQGRISQKYGFQMCLLAVLGSQGIVVKCTAHPDSRHLFSYRGLQVSIWTPVIGHPIHVHDRSLHEYPHAKFEKEI